MEIINYNNGITTTAPSYTKLDIKELNNKKDIRGEINNTVLLYENENTIMKDVMALPSNAIVSTDLGTAIWTTSVGVGESTNLGANNNTNPVGIGESTTLGTTSIGNGESTMLGVDISVNSIRADVGTTLGTTLVGAVESITLGANYMNTVGVDVGTTLGTSVGAGESTILVANYSINSVGADVGSNLGTTNENTRFNPRDDVINKEFISRYEIMEKSTFGKTSKGHSFTSFEHT